MQTDNGDNPFHKMPMEDVSQFGQSVEPDFSPNTAVDTEINIEEEIPNFPIENEESTEDKEQAGLSENDSAEIVSLDAFRKNK